MEYQSYLERAKQWVSTGAPETEELVHSIKAIHRKREQDPNAKNALADLSETIDYLINELPEAAIEKHPELLELDTCDSPPSELDTTEQPVFDPAPLGSEFVEHIDQTEKDRLFNHLIESGLVTHGVKNLKHKIKTRI